MGRNRMGRKARDIPTQAPPLRILGGCTQSIAIVAAESAMEAASEEVRVEFRFLKEQDLNDPASSTEQRPAAPGSGVARTRGGCTRAQLARIHVFDHTLTLRGGSFGCHRQLLS